tara:strand:- start:1617 stop:3713 length:2097 start_codon:yes stop_codon:yes gene_type:complete
MNLNKNFQPIQCTSSDDINITQNGEILSRRFEDIYFFPKKGAEETDHTFLNGNNIPKRWEDEFLYQKNNDFFIIGETGFGTGLNFLCTWNKWRETTKNKKNNLKKSLYFISTELYPLTFSCLKKIISNYDPYPELSKELLKFYPDAIGGDYFLSFDDDKEWPVKLILLFGDSYTCLSRLENYSNFNNPFISKNTIEFDAWFLDGFSPNKNPKMWSTELLNIVSNLSKNKTTLATFSSARVVKKGLENAGFEVKKISGYGKKRDMITARLNPKKNHSKNEIKFRITEKCKESLSYCRNKNFSKKNKDIVIIGAGIAGCTMAYQLKKRGHNVTIIDRESDVAQKASGNLKAILYSKTSKERSSSADFYEASMNYAQQFYRRLHNKSLSEGLVGMIKLNESLDKNLLIKNNELRTRRNISKSEIKLVSGLDTKQDGIFYPYSGWLNPHDICNYLLTSLDIDIITNSTVVDLERSDNKWIIKTDKNQFNCDTVVISCGYTSSKFDPINWLNIKPIRGQTTHLPTSEHLQNLKTVLCYSGYITPASNMIHEVGSSYNLDNLEEDINAFDNDENINKLLTCFENDSLIKKEIIEKKEVNIMSGYTSIRATTPDYMPIIGPISEKSTYIDEYKNLNNMRNENISGITHIKDLYINTGFGSNGFTTSPLASEIIISYIEGTPMPISEPIRRAISPNRFLYREQKRK